MSFQKGTWHSSSYFMKISDFTFHLSKIQYMTKIFASHPSSTDIESNWTVCTISAHIQTPLDYHKSLKHINTCLEETTKISTIHITIQLDFKNNYGYCTQSLILNLFSRSGGESNDLNSFASKDSFWFLISFSDLALFSFLEN